MNTYQTAISKNNKYRLDNSKRNILLIGKAETNNKQRVILNPLTSETARSLYGNSELYRAYDIARTITNDSNIFTVNCQLVTDFIELIDDIVHYNFDFIVPIDIFIRDTFVDPGVESYQYFLAYYLELLGAKENNAMIIATDYRSTLYDSIDSYVKEEKQVLNKFIDMNSTIINKYGNNIMFVLNNFKDCEFANVVLAASLSSYNFKSYPVNIKYSCHFDIDAFDLNNRNICFYKYHDYSNESTIEQLYNLRTTNDIYKSVLIDLLIKYVVKQLDMSEFNGSLYTPYTLLKINKKVIRLLDELEEEVFKAYAINEIYYNKITVNSGDIIIDISIVPYGLLEKINICIEV